MVKNATKVKGSKERRQSQMAKDATKFKWSGIQEKSNDQKGRHSQNVKKKEMMPKSKHQIDDMVLPKMLATNDDMMRPK